MNEEIPQSNDLEHAVKRLTDEVRDLRDYIQKARVDDYVRRQLNWKQRMRSSFLSGVAGGLGGVIGATLVLALLVYILSQLQWVPLIGDWVAQIVEVVEERNR